MKNSDTVIEKLQACGYELLQRDLQLPREFGRRPKFVDIVCWGTRDDRALEPLTAVICDVRDDQELLSELVHIRDALGTIQHLVFNPENSCWRQANSSLTTFETIDTPSPIFRTAFGAEVVDPYLVKTLLSERAQTVGREAAARFRLTTHSRDLGSRIAFEVARVFVEILGNGLPVAVGNLAINRVVALKLMPRLMHPFMAPTELAASEAVSNAMRQLAGEHVRATVLDPFFGLGMSALTLLAGDSRPETINGIELDPDTQNLATAIAAYSPVPTEIRLGDSFTPSEEFKADLVLTVPPFGLKLATPVELLNGETTREGDIASIDVGLRNLNPGGRLVIQLPARFLFSKPAEKYRNYLTCTHWVAALIGLPKGSVPGVSIQTVLLVIDKAKSGQTLVANLGDDWRDQLEPDSSLMAACAQHFEKEGEDG